MLEFDRFCRSFHPVRGYLSSSRLQGVYIIHATDIVCHFAKLSMEGENADVMHVLQLDCVRECLYVLNFCL